MTQRPISDKSKLSSPFDPTVHKTERTANQKMVEWMNRIIREAPLDLGLAEQETTAADGKQPDIVIFERPGSPKALCVIELKRPYFDPFDEKELKEPAREKATVRKAISPEEVSLDKVKPERRELDRIVMGEILGLSDEEQLGVYRAVVDLVKSRIEKAKSFGKSRRPFIPDLFLKLRGQ